MSKHVNVDVIQYIMYVRGYLQELKEYLYEKDEKVKRNSEELEILQQKKNEMEGLLDNQKVHNSL